jgi:uncharacterized RDD family membrane protein YckC
VTGPEYAGIVSRTVAYVVDALIVALLVNGTALGVALISAVFTTEVRDLVRDLLPLFFVLLPTVWALYSGIFWALAGRTPGMALLGLRVLTTSGRRASWPASFVRAALLAYLPVTAVWSLVDRRRQGIHDKLARTIVVRAAEPAARTTTTVPSAAV